MNYSVYIFILIYIYILYSIYNYNNKKNNNMFFVVQLFEQPLLPIVVSLVSPPSSEL